jgi:hypothetical protein
MDNLFNLFKDKDVGNVRSELEKKNLRQIFDEFIKTLSDDINTSQSSESEKQEFEKIKTNLLNMFDEQKEKLKEHLINFITSDYEINQRIFVELKINEKMANEFKINLYKLQFNILIIYLRKTLPPKNCDKELSLIINLFNKKFEAVNNILLNNLTDYENKDDKLSGKLDEERKRLEEFKRKQEEEAKRKQEEENKKKEEEENKRKQEEENKKKEEEAKRKEEEENKRKEEEENKRKEEEENKRKEEEAKRKQEEENKRKEEEENKRKEEEENKRKEEEENKRKEEEEAERKKKEDNVKDEIKKLFNIIDNEKLEDCSDKTKQILIEIKQYILDNKLVQVGEATSQEETIKECRENIQKKINENKKLEIIYPSINRWIKLCEIEVKKEVKKESLFEQKKLLDTKFGDNAETNATLVYNELNTKDQELINNIGNLNIKQSGGTSNDLTELVKKIKYIYDIYNSDLLLKLLCIISYKNKFDELAKKINIGDPKKYISDYFISLEYFKNIKKLILQDNNYIIRDTEIYKQYDNNIEEHILAHTFIKELIKRPILELTANFEFSQDLYNSIRILSNNIVNIYKNYNNLWSQYDTINRIHNDILRENQKIFAFIKERRDTLDINPRFNIKKEEVGDKSYLLMRYYNTPEYKDYKQQIKFNDNEKEYYYFGTYDGTYLKSDNKSNKQIAENVASKILNKILEKDEDICIIGYGQSGSGKTSTLIYLKTEQKEENGIIVELCNLKKITDNFERITLNMTNIYTIQGDQQKKSSVYENKYYKTNSINIEEDNPSFILLNNEWIYEKDKEKITKRGLGKFISDAFDKREIEPTPNNPDSSRSHVIVCLNLFKKNSQESRKIVICDLAGVENVFDCENPNEINNFDGRYQLSKKYNQQDVNSREIIFDRYLCDQYGEKISNNPIYGSTDMKDELELTNKYNQGQILIQAYNNMIGEAEIKEKSVSPKNSPVKRGGAIQCSNEAKLKHQCPKKLQYYNEHKGINHNIITKINEYKNMTINLKKIWNIISNNQNVENIYDNILTEFADKKQKAETKNDIAKRVREIIKDLKITKDKRNLDIPNTSLKTILEIIKNQNQLDALKTLYTNNYNNMKNWICEHLRLLKLNHNCVLRRNEGFMINHSLANMRNDIKNLVKNSLKKDKKFLPIFYDKEIYPYCRNINVEENYFDMFYDDSSYSVSGKILDIMQNEYKIDVSKMNYVIFTVINTTKKDFVNNPPNPPYININNLYYERYISNNPEKLKLELNNIISKASQYEIYKNDENIKNGSGDDDENNRGLAERIIKLITTNNASTLIGSLESTDVIQSLTYDKVVCSYNKELDKILTRYQAEFLQTPNKSRKIIDVNNTLI